MYFQLYVKRRESKLQQKDVAKMLNIHPVTYSRKETGKTDFELKEAFFLADYFGTTVDELFTKEATQ